MIILSCFIAGQTNERSVQGAFGAVTIDGKIWNQIAIRPILPFGKLSVALDLVLYIDQDGNIHENEWDFSSGEKVKNSLIDKIYYIKYGSRSSGNYFRIGALDNVTMGDGILLNGYTNALLYPQVRKVGLEFRTTQFGLKFHGFTNDFKENLGLSGIRVSGPIKYGVSVGVSFVGDRNQFLGLKDSDGDFIPDFVDDFPENESYWLDSDYDGLADNDPTELDRDGDGLPDIADLTVVHAWWDMLGSTVGYDFSSEPFYDSIPDNDVVLRDEPLNVKETKEAVQSFALDFGLPLIKDGSMTVNVYSQYAALLGDTWDPESQKKVGLGSGLTPIGVDVKFGPAKLNFEYRIMPKGKFEFGYFNKSYEMERATFSSMDSESGSLATKSNQLGYFGKQKGYFSGLTLDLGSMFDAGVYYQNLNGEKWNDETNHFEESANQSFSSILKLTKSISKIKSANWYYQQRNVPNPFNFEYTETTIMGYNVGVEMANGMILTYSFRRSFMDQNGDGDVTDDDDMINMTLIETSFFF